MKRTSTDFMPHNKSHGLMSAAAASWCWLQKHDQGIIFFFELGEPHSQVIGVPAMGVFSHGS